MGNPRVTWGKAVILELKFTDRFTEWFAELVRVFNLQPSGAAKCVDGLADHSSRAISSTTGRPGRKNATEIVNYEFTCPQL
jgi:hypothetical protein